jgi:hypothetical protein
MGVAVRHIGLWRGDTKTGKEEPTKDLQFNSDDDDKRRLSSHFV